MTKWDQNKDTIKHTEFLKPKLIQTKTKKIETDCTKPKSKNAKKWKFFFAKNDIFKPIFQVIFLLTKAVNFFCWIYFWIIVCHTCTRSYVKIFNTTYHTWAKVTVDQKKRRQAKKFCDFRKKRIRFRLANTTYFSIFCRILLHVFRKRKLVHVCFRWNLFYLQEQY